MNSRDRQRDAKGAATSVTQRIRVVEAHLEELRDLQAVVVKQAKDVGCAPDELNMPDGQVEQLLAQAARLDQGYRRALLKNWSSSWEEWIQDRLRELQAAMAQATPRELPPAADGEIEHRPTRWTAGQLDEALRPAARGDLPVLVVLSLDEPAGPDGERYVITGGGYSRVDWGKGRGLETDFSQYCLLGDWPSGTYERSRRDGEEGFESFEHSVHPLSARDVLALISRLPAGMPLTVSAPTALEDTTVDDFWITWAGFDKEGPGDDAPVDISRVVIVAEWPAGNYLQPSTV